MPRPVALLTFAVVVVTAGSVALELQTPSVAQSVSPLAPIAAARPAPAWKNGSWLNAEKPLTLDEIRGKVILLNFWVYTCYNCTNSVPSLVNFHHQYRDRGLVVIGIHTPEFPPYSGEHDRANVAQALAHYGIEYPNAQDNDSRTWNLYGIRFWPSFVLIDKKGEIRYQGAGEFHLNDHTYQTWDSRIQELLAE